LQTRLRVWFSGERVEKIFSDSLADQVNSKSYSLLESPLVSVIGEVDEYDPESIWISVRSKNLNQEELEEIAKKSDVFYKNRSHE